MNADIRTMAGADGFIEINFAVPVAKSGPVLDALCSMLALTGLRPRRVDADGDEIVPVEEVLEDVTPAMTLRGLRVKEDITQTELAERIGISQNMVSEMESGKRTITTKMAKRIADAFGVSYKAFL